jgi:kynurenine formamidase
VHPAQTALDKPAELPEYKALPIDPTAPAGSSWWLWGRTDRLGTLNLLSPRGVASGMASVRTGEAIGLNAELSLPNPELIGRKQLSHRYAPIGEFGADDELDGFNTQLSSQWDGFGHVRHPRYGHYNGLRRDQLGVEHWSAAGICGRGVLADVARWRARTGRPLRPDSDDPISADDLRDTLAAQGTELQTGDILLIRTGWLEWYADLPAGDRAEVDHRPCRSPGLAQSEDVVAYLWDTHVAAVAADNTSLERAPFRQIDDATPGELASPGGTAAYTLMYNLLSLLGLPFGELFDLRGLAVACAGRGDWTFLFTSAPINLRGAIGSAANATAVL